MCHSCRARGHFFTECRRKRPCPECKHGFEKRFKVEKETANKGRLFLCCSENCGFWDWVVKEECSGESSSDNAEVVKLGTTMNDDAMSQMFKSRVHLNDDEDLLISVNLKICKPNSSTGANASRKRPT